MGNFYGASILAALIAAAGLAKPTGGLGPPRAGLAKPKDRSPPPPNWKAERRKMLKVRAMQERKAQQRMGFKS